MTKSRKDLRQTVTGLENPISGSDKSSRKEDLVLLDPRKLIAAWSANSEVMKEVLHAIEQVMAEYELMQKSNAAVRQDNLKTRNKVEELLCSTEKVAARQAYVGAGQLAVILVVMLSAAFTAKQAYDTTVSTPAQPEKTPQRAPKQ